MTLNHFFPCNLYLKNTLKCSSCVIYLFSTPSSDPDITQSNILKRKLERYIVHLILLLVFFIIYEHINLLKIKMKNI